MSELLQKLISLLQRLKLWVIIQPWERAVRVRLGRRVKSLESGFHWRIPLLDIVARVNTRLRIASMPALTVATRDGKTMTVAGNVAFRIDDPFKTMMMLNAPESGCSAFAQRSAATYIASRDHAQLSVVDFEKTVSEDIRDAIDGITVEWFSAVDFATFRTLRLLQENWRPGTGHTQIDDLTS